MVDTNSINGLVCKHLPSRVVRHHARNDCISCAFSAAGIPGKKKPAGIIRSDGKRPDGCTFIPWRRDKPLAWDVTVWAMTTASYVTAARCTAGAAAEKAADRKCAKYTELSAGYEFQSVAVKSHGPLSEATASFLVKLGSKISQRSGEPLETQFLFQRVSMLIQCFDSILYHETFPVEVDTDT